MESRPDLEAELEVMKQLCKKDGVDTEGTSGSVSDQLQQLERRFEEFSLRQSIEAYEKKYNRKEGPRYHEQALGVCFVSLPMASGGECYTTPQVCYWAGSVAFHQEFVDIRKKVVYTDHGERMVRKFAGINGAFRRGYYEVSQYASYDYPAGATGKKIEQPKFARGGKGLRRPGDADVPDDMDIYVPKGISRKLENRPPRGRWFFPRPSRLSNEYTP